MTLTQDTLEAMAHLYGANAEQLQPVTGGHFAYVYEYAMDQRARVLKIIPPNTDLDLNAMRAVLEWMAFLAAHDGPVVRPLPSRNGRLIETVENGDQILIAVAFDKAPGVLAEGAAPEAWSDALMQALGRTLGKCHRIAQDYVPTSDELLRPQWQAGGSCFNPQEDLENAASWLLAQRAQTLRHIEALPKERENYGLAHLDLHFGNFFVDADAQRIVLLDFDDCAYGWYVMDLAMLLFDVLVLYEGTEPLAFGAHFLEQLLRGYCTEMPLNHYWIRQLPHFLKLVEIGVYAMLYRDYDPATADRWVGKFMRGRRERIEAGTPYVDLDFGAILEVSNCRS